MTFDEQSKQRQEEITEKVYDLLSELYEVESAFAEEIYDPIGLTEEVKTYMRYNANKAMSNLGFDPLFSEEDTQVHPVILSSLSLTGENHDFFSRRWRVVFNRQIRRAFRR